MEDTHVTEAQQQAALQKQLWAVANDLRGNMDPSEYRNYMLGLIFYRFLSEKVEDEVNMLLENDEMTFAEAYEDEDYREGLKNEVTESLGFFIEPRHLYSSLINDIDEGRFDIEELQNAINEIENSTLGVILNNDFKGLFADMNLSSNRLGNTVAQRGELMAKVMHNLNDIPFKQSELKIDVLGDAYEYLISQFAASAGKKSWRILHTATSFKDLGWISFHG